MRKYGEQSDRDGGTTTILNIIWYWMAFQCGIDIFSLCLHRFSASHLASFPILYVHVRLIEDSKL